MPLFKRRASKATRQPTLQYKTSNKVKMSVADLKIGMFVAALDRPWEGTPFLFQGFTIETEHDIKVLAEYCEVVAVDIESSVDFQIQRRPRQPTAATTLNTRVTKKADDVGQRLSRAQRTFQASSKIVRDIMDDVRLGKSVDTPAARAAVTECVDNVIENPDAMTLLTRIRDKDAYTSEHSLSVSILTVALGRQLGMQRAPLIELGMAGLLHDVGKVLTPDPVLKKPGRLTDEEFAVMREHPTQGRDILMSGGGSTLKALDVAHGHHERIDGGGYPRGLKGDQLPLFTRMVSITDAFDAITSDRIYDNARTNMDAFRILTKGRGSQWDSKLVVRFVETVGIFAPGTAVEMSNGMLAVVVATNKAHKLRPKLVLTHTQHGPLLPPVIVDLAHQLDDENGEALHIARVLRPSVAGISLKQLREQGLLDDMQNLPTFRQVFKAA